ncbi:MAG TPA: hypothetical protein VMS18_29885 [Candidatus Binatia bacterium]|nr:hypothetical protein [Candidatus Binatia bacterium]
MFIAGRLPYVTATGGRFLELGPHRAHIVSGGNYGKKNEQQAAERQEGVERIGFSSLGGSSGIAP